ncbi:MAG: hypothetical protein FK732_10055 [Asgard group archaeon]|nr:hypothetical protein [Asgard group archaeon]
MIFNRSKSAFPRLFVITTILGLIIVPSVIDTKAETNSDYFPKPRYGHNLVYIPTDGSIYLYGGDYGYQSGVLLKSLWRFNLASKLWTEITSDNGPPSTTNSGFAYDSNNNQLVLYGGFKTDNYDMLADVWTFSLDTQSWTEHSLVVKPDTRSDSSFYYDPIIDGCVMYGGYAENDTLLSDTWIFFTSNNSWSVVDTTSPGSRYGHHMVYNTHDQVGLMFGGRTTTYTDETWQFNTSDMTWTQITTAHMPTKRYWYSYAIAEERNEFYIFSGRNDGYPDSSIGHFATYNLTSQDWNQTISAEEPGSRFMSSMVYHEELDCIFLFSGTTGFSYNKYNDYWLYHISNKTWTRLTSNTPTVSASFDKITISSIITLAFVCVTIMYKKKIKQ